MRLFSAGLAVVALALRKPTVVRPSGVRLAYASRYSPGTPAAIGVSIKPGATEFTVISGAKALERARVSMMTPALEAQ